VRQRSPSTVPDGRTAQLAASLNLRANHVLEKRAVVAISIEALGLAVLLGLAVWIFLIPFHNATNYDEGNYLAALTDLRHGYALGKDVYADQPPGWYSLLRFFAWVFGNSLTGIRTGLLIVSVAGVAAAWACARPFGPLPAFGAGALLLVAPPYPAQATQVEADTAAAVLALGALAFAAWAYRGKGSPALAASAGALIACAVSVKLSAATALLPLAALALLRRRLIPWSLLGIVVVAAVELIAFRNDLGDITRGAIGQHTTALGSSHWSRSVNVHRLLHFLNSHTPFSWLVLAGAVATIWLAVTRAPGARRLGAYWLFVPAAAGFILAMKPLLDHHLVILSVSLAVPAGAALGLAATRLRADGGAVMALLVVTAVAAGIYQQHRQLVRSTAPEPEWVHRGANWLRAESDPADVVATDIPIVAYYAHRRLVPDFVDSSFTRLGVGELTPAKVSAELDRYHVQVAAIGRTFWADQAIRTVFDTRFRHRKLAPNIVFYSGSRTP
jgi:4-amino-4-deoxy-L-arabinose transferase-like glycosyltransferase